MAYRPRVRDTVPFVEWVLLIVVVIVIPNLLVGHLAGTWGRDRFGWTVAAFLISWPLTLAALLVVGRENA